MKKLGIGITGSFCNLVNALDIYEELSKDYEITFFVSYTVQKEKKGPYFSASESDSTTLPIFNNSCLTPLVGVIIFVFNTSSKRFWSVIWEVIISFGTKCDW